MPKLGTADPVFYRRWIVANGWAEAAGLGTTFVLGRALAPWLEHATGAVVVLLGVLAAVLLGTLLEGLLVGVAQEAVLRDRLASLRKRTWMLATAAGAAFAWLLGMIPNTVLALRPQDAAASPLAEPSGSDPVRAGSCSRAGCGAGARLCAVDCLAKARSARRLVALGERGRVGGRDAVDLPRHGIRAVDRAFCGNVAGDLRRLRSGRAGSRRHSRAIPGGTGAAKAQLSTELEVGLNLFYRHPSAANTNTKAEAGRRTTSAR